MADEKLGVIGRDAVLTELVAKQAHKALSKIHPHTNLHEIRRGQRFEVQVVGPEGQTNHLVRVTVELLGVLEESEF